MAKVSPGRNLPFSTLQYKFYGRLQFAHVKGQLIAKSWPRKRPGKPTQAQQDARDNFLKMVQAVKDSRPEDIIGAMEIARGTAYTWRDVLSALVNGNFVQVPGVQMITTQAALDAITEAVGAILYRSPTGWIGLEPGDDFQVLQLVDGVPKWADEAAPVGGITQLHGDASAGPGTGDQAIVLADTSVSPGSYTLARLTVSAKGLVTLAEDDPNLTYAHHAGDVELDVATDSGDAIAIGWNGSGYLQNYGGGQLDLYGGPATAHPTKAWPSGGFSIGNASGGDPGDGNVNVAGQYLVNGTPLGTGPGIVATFDTSTSTVATVAAYAGAAAIVATIADGDAYRFRAIVRKQTTSYIALILSNAKNAAHGFFWQFNTNGVISLTSDTTTFRATGTGTYANNAGWIVIEGTIAFTNAADNFIYHPDAGAPYSNNIANFVGGPLYCAIAGVSSASNIKSVIFTKL